MNAKNLRATADAVERSETYDQSCWLHTCGTPGCLAGHAAALSLKRGERLATGRWQCDAWVQLGRKRQHIEQRAASFLGCSDLHHLFAPLPEHWWPEPFRARWIKAGKSMKKQRRVAAAYLRHRADQADKEAEA